jgi:toxin CcdB
MRRAFLAARIRRLHPEFEIDGEVLVLATHLAAAVRRSELRQLKTNLSDQRDRIVGAIDVIAAGV